MAKNIWGFHIGVDIEQFLFKTCSSTAAAISTTRTTHQNLACQATHGEEIRSKEMELEYSDTSEYSRSDDEISV